jgi:hypothetical protein
MNTLKVKKDFNYFKRKNISEKLPPENISYVTGGAPNYPPCPLSVNYFLPEISPLKNSIV